MSSSTRFVSCNGTLFTASTRVLTTTSASLKEKRAVHDKKIYQRDFFSWHPKRPYADVSPALGTAVTDRNSEAFFVLRGRVLWEDEIFTDFAKIKPRSRIFQYEMSYASLQLVFNVGGKGQQRVALGTIDADDEGYVDSTVSIPGPVPPGRHFLEIDVNGHPAAESRVHLLGNDTADLVVRSDIDMTYLVSNFQNLAGMSRLLSANAHDRQAIVGMPTIYKALRQGLDGEKDRPLCFVSGSPPFFKRTLEARLQLDGISYDGISLKNWHDAFWNQIVEARGRHIIAAIKEQIGYKLDTLFKLRLEIPAHVPEILLGDDTEADFVVYCLYHQFTSGNANIDELHRKLLALGVKKDWRSSIQNIAIKVAEYLQGFPPPVRAIYINQVKTTRGIFSIVDWSIPGLTRYHQGSWPLALDLCEEGLIAKEHVWEVRSDLESAGTTQLQLALSAADAVEKGFLDKETVDSLSL